MLLSKARAQPQHPLDALELVQPLLENRSGLVAWNLRPWKFARRTKLPPREPAVARERAITSYRARFEVLGRKDDHWNAAASADFQLL